MRVPRNRFLKYINLLIALALLTALAAGYWVFYRPLPQTSGEVTAPIRAAASVVRDKLGVPHIRAGSEEDAFFLQGFLTAQDRFFQMDLSRRRGAGELAEIFGAGAVESDREARRMRLDRIAEQYVRNLHGQDRAWFAAYARGVNFYLERNRNRLPAEFRILNYNPRPWSISDSVLVALNIFRTFSESWREDIRKQSFLAEGDSKKVRTLFPARTPLEDQPGSNAWVLSGSWTASGKPLLASDPHLPFSLPCFWYEVHLQAPGLDVIGASVPGLPGVIIGHNRRIAWASTNLRFDVQDLYMERLNPATGVFAYRGRLLRAVRETELIPVRDRKPVPLSKWVTVHGPIVISRGELQLALRWTAAEAGPFVYPFFAINRAQNWGQFREALRDYRGPAQNFVYADVDGNIGYQAAGMLPRRRSYQGDVPVDGSSGRFEWDGFIPFDELPTLYNPPSGRIISANQNPFPKNYSYRVSGSFAPGYRWRRIQKLLAGRRDWKARDLLSVQTDVYSAFLHFLAGELVTAWDKRAASSGSSDKLKDQRENRPNAVSRVPSRKRAGDSQEPGLAQAVALLRNWDGKMDRNQPAPLIARLLYEHLRRSIATRVAPKAGVAYTSPMAPAVIEHLLRERPPGWFDSYDELLLGNFVDAVEEGKRMQGDDPGRWKYGRYNQLVLTSVVDRVPLLGNYLRLRPVALSGGSTTVQQVAGSLTPSMRLVADLADWDNSLMNLTLGESGQRFSSHFRDQWRTYQDGGSFPLIFEQFRAKTRLEFIPER